MIFDAPPEKVRYLRELQHRAEQAKATLSPDQERWQADPCKWVTDQFPAEPDEWQAESLTALANGKHIAVRSGHGVGKTAMLAWSVLWWLDTHEHPRVPCAAPTEHQLIDLLWPEMDLWLGRSVDLKSRIGWQATRVFVRGRQRSCFASQVTAGPDAKAENLAGFHAGDLLYVVDEASGVADRNFIVITGALTTEGARLVMTGNPTRTSGYFAKRFVNTPDGWHVATVSSTNSKRVDNEWAESVADEWGKDSDEYRVRVLGLPPRGDASGFIPPEYVDQAMVRQGPAFGPLVLGVDVARYGRDKTAIAVRRGTVVTEIRTFRKLGNPQVAQKVIDVADELALDGETVRIIVDDGGVGGGVTDLLNVARRERTDDMVRLSVSGVTFGGAGDHWYTTNAGVWWHRLRKLMQEHLLTLPDDDDLRQQLTDRTSAMNLKGKTVLESKDHMRDRGVSSPDKADAVALTVADGGQGQAFIEFWRKRVAGQSTSADPLAVTAKRESANGVHPDIAKHIERRQRRNQANVTVATARGAACQHQWGPPFADGTRFCTLCQQRHP